MKKIAIATACLLALAGCYDEPQVAQEKPRDARVVRHNISYFRDYTTDLCFALTTTQFFGDRFVDSVTEVECTEKVRLSIRYGR